jgi:branched-chain amino acid transport system permease protein
MTAASSSVPQPRMSLGRWRLPIGVLIALVVAFFVILLGTFIAPEGTEQMTTSRAIGLAQDQFINAMTIGALYALVALGYTMVYGIIELINFAHGDVWMAGSFVSWWVLTSLGINGPISDPVWLTIVLVLCFTASMLSMGVVGVIIERFAYRPLRNAPRLAPLITAIGVSYIIENLAEVLISDSIVTIPRPIANTQLDFGLFQIGVVNLFVIILALVLMSLLHLFINRTRLGRAMRSTAADRDAAQLMGVNINQTIAITFFVGSALAGAAGVVQGLYLGFSQFQIGFYGGLRAFTAAVLGGIGNTTGAAIGGFVIGFLEVISNVFGYGKWSEAVVFGILVLVLVFRPSGILGQQLGERA